MIRNTAGQTTLIGPLELIADGSAVTSGAAISTRIGGATAAGAGTLAHVSGGVWEYAPTQAETDTPTLGLVLSGTGARSVGLAIETTRLPVQTAAGTANGLPVLDGSAHLLAYSVSQPVTVNAINGLAPPANWDALTIAGGKVAATVGTGDSADAASVKATIGTAGAGLTSIPYTGPAAPTDYQQRGVAVTLPSTAPAGYGVSGTVDANLVSILNDTVSVQNFKADELATAPTIPTAAQNAAAVWDLATTGHETTGSFGALVAAGGSGGTIDYAAMETYFAAHGGLSANAIAIAGSAPAGINLRDDELATAPTLPAVDSLGRVTVGTVADKVGYSLNLAQSGLVPRALDSVADSALTLGDALVAAIAGAAGKESISGSSYLIKTPFTGTPIRSFTLDSTTNPTSRT